LGVRFQRPFIAHGGSVHSSVKELVEQLQQFLPSQDLYRAVWKSFVKDELLEIVFRQNDCPDHLAQRHTLFGAAPANFHIALLDITLIFVKQPLSQVAIDFIYPLLQFLWRDFVEAGAVG